MNLDLSISQLAVKYRSGEVTPEVVVNECLENIERNNPELNIFITLRDKQELLDEARSVKFDTLLSGVPYVLKDAYVTKNIRTTSASNVLNNYVPDYDATVVRKLKEAGAILIGKTNMDAWGHGGSSENTDFGPVKNPWDQTRVAGGSSGGAAAAVSARMAMFAIGEDTGGSIRNPAGWCGISGLKVTYGRVSRYGAIAYASSLDSVGPMAKNVEDLSLILELIAGQDKLDATSSPNNVPIYSKNLNIAPSTIKIGVPFELDSQIKEAVGKLVSMGAQIIDISLPMLKYAVSTYYLLAPSETSSNLGRYDGIRFGQDRSNFTQESMRRIMIGTYALSAGYYDAYYKKAQQVRTKIIEDYNKAFEKCDVIIMPVAPTVATKLGELISDPIKNMLADLYMVTTNIAGIPSLAIPCGFEEGMPVGFQIQGPMFSEELLFKIGHQYQQVTDWHKAKPNL
ncbi:MAG: Asp-tRNA(Asn)/Glu-tRNA(Gln) amidotransferase subunit GatA [Candidatus Amesbacteria bacterium]|nr:Asp-tRNA(Asn)/Glu-tRNA(Gln) amidotransferase subunit GatA [Candidatus Amesbacteria bacterium]